MRVHSTKRCDWVKINEAYFSYFSNSGTRLDLFTTSPPAIWQYLKVSWAIARVQEDHSAEQGCVLLRAAGDAVERIPDWHLETCLFLPTLPLIYWVSVGKFLDGSFLFKMERQLPTFLPKHYFSYTIFGALIPVPWKLCLLKQLNLWSETAQAFLWAGELICTKPLKLAWCRT